MTTLTPAHPHPATPSARAAHHDVAGRATGSRGKYALLVLLVLTVQIGLQSIPSRQEQPSGCRFALGFAQLRARLGPGTVGPCLDDEWFDPRTGDTVQPTVRGLLVWRKTDGGTAFSDGHRTWIAGPFGLQQRLNTERFCWEAGAAGRCLTAADASAAGADLPFEHEIGRLIGALVETVWGHAEIEWNAWWARVALWLARAAGA